MLKADVIEIAKACIAAFMKARNSLVVSCTERKKTEDGHNYCFKTCSWPNFYEIDFMEW